MEIIYYIIIVNILLAFKLWWDYRAKNVQHRVINHELSALIDGFIYLISGFLLFGFNIGAIFLITLSYRWIFYDLGYNLLNKEEWNHYGESSKLDIFLKKTGRWHIVIKLIPAIIGIIILNIN